MEIAIVGCGAIVESFYMPAINKRDSINKIYLIDRNLDRAQAIQALIKTDSQVLDNYISVLDKVDGAIIATPPSSHFTIAKDFLNKNIPVLVEKPLAETQAEVNELVEILGAMNGKLMVNNTRRYFPTNQAIKKAITDGVIGDLERITYHEGGEYNWPTVSGFYFNKEANAKGVMMDRGAHVIDLISWWVDDDIKLVRYEDDSLGGPEAFAHGILKTKTCEIDVKLSWLNKLTNEYSIVGTEGEISGSIYNWKSYSLAKNGKKKTVKIKHNEKLFNDFGDKVFKSFIHHINGNSSGFTVSANDVLQSIQLIEKMYNNRKRIETPWQNFWLNYAG